MSLGLFYEFLSLDDSQQISVYRVRLSASRRTPSLEDQAFVFTPLRRKGCPDMPPDTGKLGYLGIDIPVPTYMGPEGT
jgi:hypothetical protein